jgi:hypothetical protein
MNARAKDNRRYLFYRAYTVLVILAWNVVIGRHFFKREPPGIDVLALVPLFLPALFLVFNLMAFRLPFSAFGAYERTPLPITSPLIEKRFTSGVVGLLNATSPFYSWYLYADGIGFHIFGVGRGFVPLAAVKSSQPAFMGGVTITHDSPEVRSPLRIPSREFLIDQSSIQVAANRS